MDRSLPSELLPVAFDEPSRLLPLSLIEEKIAEGEEGTTRTLTIEGGIPPATKGGALTIWLAGKKKNVSASQEASAPFGAEWFTPVKLEDFLASEGRLNGTSVAFTPLVRVERCPPPPWQSWQVAVEASLEPQPFALPVTITPGLDHELDYRALYVPN